MNPKPLFFFVSNRLHTEPGFSCELIPGYMFRRALTTEIDRIREQVLQDESGFLPVGYVYESIGQIKESSGTSKIASYVPLPPEEWRYFVIDTPITSQPESERVRLDLEKASLLTSVELNLRYTFFEQGVHFARSPMSAFEGGTNIIDFPDGHHFDGDLATQIGTNYELLKKTADAKDIHSSCNMLHGLRYIDEFHPLYILGLFAVIESLLTHDPKGGYDSLGHQIKTKMSLLSKRLANPIDYSAFAQMKPETVWSKLYDYRSKIAHGGDPKLDESLKNFAVCRSFLKDACKAILRYALTEPELIRDLRAC